LEAAQKIGGGGGGGGELFLKIGLKK